MSLDVCLRASHGHREPVTVSYESNETDVLYSANITHNLAAMAGAAGIYQHLWRPDEIGASTARDLIEPLRDGLLRLEHSPELFRRLSPENGWGTYDGLVEFVRAYLAACEAHPDARVEVSR